MSFKIAAGSVTGPHHRAKGEQNQDFYGSQEAEDVIIIAAADGAGSLQHASTGAQISVLVSITACLDALDTNASAEDAIAEALQITREELLAHPQASTIGCTLALGILHKDYWALGVVGDAFGVVQTADDFTFVQPQSISEYANITALMTSETFAPHIITGSGASGLAVATDGLEPASIQQQKAIAGFWTPVFTRTAENRLQVEALLTHMDTMGKIADDTTLVAAVIDES